MNNLTQAKHRWPNAKIVGDGPYACVELSVHWTQQRIWLCDSFEQAKRCQLGCERSEVINLSVDMDAILERMPDRHEDADERRARRRAERAAL